MKIDRTLISLSLISASLLTSAIAHADEKRDLADEIQLHDNQISRLRKNYTFNNRTSIEKCNAAVAKAKAAGYEEAEKWTKTCDEYVKYHRIAEVQHVLNDAQDWIYLTSQIDVATRNVDNADKLVESSVACGKEVDRVLGLGIAAETEMEVGARVITIKLADAKKQICEPLAGLAKTYAKDALAAVAKQRAEIAAPYKKVGIKGERLELLIDHASYAMYGVGGGELTTPKQLKSAKVIFELLGDSSSIWTVRRYEFNGDKIVSVTEQEYFLKPGAKAFAR